MSEAESSRAGESSSAEECSGGRSRRPSKVFTDTGVWQKAHAFVLRIYRITSRFPREEQFGLATQLRRAAVSIPANFAEGFKKQGIADKSRFFNIAQASLEECRYYLILSRDLGYPCEKNDLALLEEVSRMLEAYRKAVPRSTGS